MKKNTKYVRNECTSEMLTLPDENDCYLFVEPVFIARCNTVYYCFTSTEWAYYQAHMWLNDNYDKVMTYNEYTFGNIDILCTTAQPAFLHTSKGYFSGNYEISSPSSYITTVSTDGYTGTAFYGPNRSGYHNTARNVIYYGVGLGVYWANGVDASKESYTATVNIRKDGEAWTQSRTVSLRLSGTVKYTKTAIASSFTFENVSPGTYDIYVGNTDTNVDIVVTTSGGTAYVDYYTLTLTVGAGINRVQGLHVYGEDDTDFTTIINTTEGSGSAILLKGSKVRLNAVVNTFGGYTWSGWTGTDGGFTNQYVSDIEMDRTRSYTAVASAPSYKLYIIPHLDYSFPSSLPSGAHAISYNSQNIGFYRSGTEPTVGILRCR